MTGTVGHTSPGRYIARRSSSPGHQSANETSYGVESSRHADCISNSQMTQSLVSAGGLFSAGSSSSLLPYQQGFANTTSRVTTGSFSSSKTKSLNLLIDRTASEFNSGSRRRMVAAAAQSSPKDKVTHSGGMSGSVGVLPYDRDQSLDRHVERRQRHRSYRDSAASDIAGRYHTIGGYGRDYRGASAEREYPHMGARALERVEHGLMRSKSIDPEFVSPGPSGISSENPCRQPHDTLLMELQSQVSDLNRECATLQHDLEMTRDKLSSSMNSVRTFWSPELKRERAQRKEDSSRLTVMVEQIRIAEVENRVSPSLIPNSSSVWFICCIATELIWSRRQQFCAYSKEGLIHIITS
jgi:RIM-binding protein of the cytomatrix active zone